MDWKIKGRPKGKIRRLCLTVRTMQRRDWNPDWNNLKPWRSREINLMLSIIRGITSSSALGSWCLSHTKLSQMKRLSIWVPAGAWAIRPAVTLLSATLVTAELSTDHSQHSHSLWRMHLTGEGVVSTFCTGTVPGLEDSDRKQELSELTAS